jgi:DNA-binding IclR family transcriptional regulator
MLDRSPEVLLPPVSSKTGRKKPSATKEDPYFSRAVGKAFELLDLVGRSENSLSLNDLARHLQLTKSSTFRLLHTLESLQHVQRDKEGHFRGVGAKSQAIQEHSVQHLRLAAAEPLRILNMEFRETISLAMLMGNHLEVIEVINSPHLMRMSNIVGRILPPHASSMGKAITAFQSPETRARLIESYGMTSFTPNTITDQRQLEECFEQVRDKRISYDDEENTLGGFCYGSPIILFDDRVTAAFSLSMPKARQPQDEIDRQMIVDRLHETAATIARAL